MRYLCVFKKENTIFVKLVWVFRLPALKAKNHTRVTSIKYQLNGRKASGGGEASNL